MLSEVQKVCFKLLQTLFIYIYPFPFQWSPNFSKLVFLKPKFIWTPWFIRIFNVFGLGVACVSVAVAQALIKPWEKFEPIQGVVLIAASILQLSPVVGAWVALKSKGTVLYGINHLLLFERRLEQNYRSRNIRKGDEAGIVYGIVDFLLLIGVISCAASPFLIALLTVVEDYDAPYFILELILPNPMYRATNVIVNTMIVRAFLIGLSVAECARTMAVAASLSLVVCNSLESILRKLNGISKTSEFIGVHVRLQITYSMMEQFSSSLVLICLGGGFWMTVEALWVVVVGFGKVPLVLYVLFFMGGIFMVIIVSVLLSRLSAVKLLCENTLERRKVKLIRQKANDRTRQLKWEEMKMKSLIPMRVGFGSFFSIDGNAAMAYCTQILDNWVNSTLLFKL